MGFKSGLKGLISFTLLAVSRCPTVGQIQTVITAGRKMTKLVLLKRGARHVTEGIRVGYGCCRNAYLLMGISAGV
jgi:hypothetical protein